MIIFSKNGMHTRCFTPPEGIEPSLFKNNSIRMQNPKICCGYPGEGLENPLIENDKKGEMP